MQHTADSRLFYTPGVFYRPNQLKSLTCLLGNTETRTVYRNFELLNLNVNLGDRSHMLYNRYLCYNRFLPPDEKRYWAHLTTNTLAAPPGNVENEKGAFNIFPISLTTEELSKSTSSALGKFPESRWLLWILCSTLFFHRCGDNIPAQAGDPVRTCAANPMVYASSLCLHLPH